MPISLSDPAGEPLTLAEAKAHTRADDADDALLTALITAAREHVEGVTRCLLFSRAAVLSLDGWADEICWPVAPLASVESVKYIDTDGNQQALDESVYRVDTNSTPGRLTPAYGTSWPAARAVTNAITINCTVGYADAGAVPQAIKQALLLLVGHWYANREASIVGAPVTDLPMAVDALLDPYRMYSL